MPIHLMQRARSSARCLPCGLKAIMLIAIGVYTVDARAASEGSATSIFSFGAFGTLGVVHSSEHRADFASSVLKPNGAGFSHSWSADPDSLIGAQLTANFTSRLSAVVQIISEQNYDNTYRPQVEWANIKYQFTPDFAIRIGRSVRPGFIVSDFRNVNYINPWVRPPTEVYSQNPITHTDGVDASYRLHLGEVTNTLQANYGRSSRFNLPAGNRVDTKTAWSISETVEAGAALLHVSYVAVKFTVTSPATGLFDAFRQFGPQGAAIADRYDLVDKPTTILAIGASYDPGGWFAMTEWTRPKSDSFIGQSTAWYVSGGYRVGKFTPYLTYAQVTDGQISSPGLTLSGVPASLVPIAAALNEGLNAAVESRPVQKTVSVGGRWDVMKNVDLKLQFDRTRLGSGSPGILMNIQPGFQPGGTVDLFSAAVDFVF